ncbi:hypothetical protein [Mucilaginibacter arboris]|uniref:Uncharacterized protein n=1 Tax=Mucilaginibacter arboris TaxID=2682090 RepID=A0A7K1SWK0_9SPHI|nr:hypothetical protein [Mucilaginibacter arboris]MVN21702.1 hypothetical protein [Mucilaginibacter arboris]
MKTETQQGESMVAQLRKIRDQISLEIQDMNSEQILAYFKSKKGLLPQEVWDKAKEHQTDLEQLNSDTLKDNSASNPPREG